MSLTSSMWTSQCLAAFIHWAMNLVSMVVVRAVEGLEPSITPVVIRSCRPEKGPMFRFVASAQLGAAEKP